MNTENPPYMPSPCAMTERDAHAVVTGWPIPRPSLRKLRGISPFSTTSLIESPPRRTAAGLRRIPERIGDPGAGCTLSAVPLCRPLAEWERPTAKGRSFVNREEPAQLAPGACRAGAPATRRTGLRTAWYVRQAFKFSRVRRHGNRVDVAGWEQRDPRRPTWSREKSYPRRLGQQVLIASRNEGGQP